MLAVLASRLDPAAHALVARWSSAGAALLSAEDLTSEGWAFRVSDPDIGTAVVDGCRLPVRELRAVLTRRQAVIAEELAWIDPVDRPYVASEANAFLVAWLSAIPCLVLSRPTAGSLAGPAWSPLHWAAAAARTGIAWAVPQEGDAVHNVTVCGETCVGARSSAEADAARALARAAGVELLGIRFSAAGPCGATLWPALEEDEVRATVLNHLLGGAR